MVLMFVPLFFLASCVAIERNNPDDPGGNYYGGGGSSDVLSGSCEMNYYTIEIGSKTWMAQNLNCNVKGGKCYNNEESNCATYGKLYDWATAMALPSSCNSSSCSVGANHRGICPEGWHIPSNAEWEALTINDEERYHSTALTGGRGYSTGGFVNIGDYGFWWSSSEYDANLAYNRYTHNRSEYVYDNYNDKSNLLSVRCVRN